jgi:hypothetical protein
MTSTAAYHPWPRRESQCALGCEIVAHAGTSTFPNESLDLLHGKQNLRKGLARKLPAKQRLFGFEGWEVGVLTLLAGQAETLWDELLPIEARELPEDLAGIDELLRDAGLLRPIAERWERSAREGRRPTIAMETYVRLMVVKQRSGFGYETLVREVSDSLHLRRFA